GTQATTQNGAHNYAAAGNYNAQLAVTTTDGCKDTVQKQVTVLGFSQAQFTTLPVCYPNATQFTNTTDVTTYPVSNFSWTFGDGTGTSTQPDPSYGYLSTGTFTATLIANFANGCADSGTAQAIVYEIPTVTSSITDASCFGGNDGIIQLTPGAGLQPFTYSWSNLATTATISSLNMGTYDVTFTDAHTCTSTGSYAVNEPTQLLLDTAVVPVQCYGYTNASITVNASAGTPGYFFTWSNGDNGSVISNLGAGTYSVTCSDSKGCSATTAVSLTDPPLYTLVLDTVADVYLGNSVTLNADAINGNPVSWLWSPADNLSCATCQTTEATLYNNYVYRVESIDDKGCKATASILVNVIPKYTVFIPNGFTPNGDGSNDFFEIFGNKEAWKQFEVAVFDRLGEKVYESNDMNFKWDGTYRGKGLNPAVFVYVIKVVYLNNFTDKVYKGSLTLLR
ncbi:MAG: gliding motility-associated C-terminal domain-containing protein, partial [Chitinophagales bacterium]|nr:gliding motility-associated C-terminal domain-containing protein [Chitinophagales bacterium]